MSATGNSERAMTMMNEIADRLTAEYWANHKCGHERSDGHCYVNGCDKNAYPLLPPGERPPMSKYVIAQVPISTPAKPSGPEVPAARWQCYVGWHHWHQITGLHEERRPDPKCAKSQLVRSSCLEQCCFCHIQRVYNSLWYSTVFGPDGKRL